MTNGIRMDGSRMISERKISGRCEGKAREKGDKGGGEGGRRKGTW